MTTRLPVNYPQSVLTLSAGPCNHPDDVGSPSVGGLTGRKMRLLRLAYKRNDRLSIATLETYLTRRMPVWR